MMQLAIYGSGGLGREVLVLAKQIQAASPRWGNIVFIDDTKPAGTDIAGVAVVSFDDICANRGGYEISIAVGEPAARHVLFDKIKAAGLSPATLIHPAVLLDESVTVKEGAIICNNAIFSGFSTVEENALVQPLSITGHDCVVGPHAVLSSAACLGGGTVVGEEAYLATGVITKEKLSIGARSIVGMGSVVHRDIPDDMIALGNPARPMRRNEDRKVFK